MLDNRAWDLGFYNNHSKFRCRLKNGGADSCFAKLIMNGYLFTKKVSGPRDKGFTIELILNFLM